MTHFLFQCKDFIDAGAEQGMTPSDVVSSADITFSCVADPQASKDVIKSAFKNIVLISQSDNATPQVKTGYQLDVGVT